MPTSLLMFQGVPVRVELGPRDIENKQFVIKIRDTGDKHTLDVDGAAAKIKDSLEKMHHRMLERFVTTITTSPSLYIYIDGVLYI